MLLADSIIDKKKNIIVKKINDEYILVPLIGNVANMKSLFTLNETAAFIWENIDGTKNANQLAEAIVEEFEVKMAEAINDTNNFLNKINGLLIIK
ncbi:MAG: hypothetical protein AUJ97_02105 [Bacteroidetes bacterium CG2_30_32_10]|nr:MAG: hypothetical protein AUJ97_02105 [Bacteroidetes bacterium CG2_30_32_10]